MDQMDDQQNLTITIRKGDEVLFESPCEFALVTAAPRFDELAIGIIGSLDVFRLANSVAALMTSAATSASCQGENGEIILAAASRIATYLLHNPDIYQAIVREGQRVSAALSPESLAEMMAEAESILGSTANEGAEPGSEDALSEKHEFTSTRLDANLADLFDAEIARLFDEKNSAALTDEPAELQDDPAVTDKTAAPQEIPALTDEPTDSQEDADGPVEADDPGVAPDEPANPEDVA